MVNNKPLNHSQFGIGNSMEINSARKFAIHLITEKNYEIISDDVEVVNGKRYHSIYLKPQKKAIPKHIVILPKQYKI